LHDLNTHRTNEDLRKSLEEFKQAVVLDPNLAKAYAGEAQTYNLLGDYDEMEGREAGPKAEAAARRALELDASLASAHAALAFALWKYSWLWSDAEAEFQKSLALNPNSAHTHHTYGVFLACRGDFASADEHLRKALTLDPLSMIVRTNLGWLEYFQHNYAKAEAAYLQVLELDPSFLTARQKLWITYALEGKTQQAEAELENVMRLFGNLDLLERLEKSPPAARFQVAVSSYIQSGLLTPYERARYLALLGRGREAVQALQEAQRQQSAWMVYLRIEPVFDRIRTTPGFDQLVRNARIPEAKAISAKN
jgi:Tfp pilus assembly protein PilF